MSMKNPMTLDICQISLGAFYYFMSFFYFDSHTIIQSGVEGRIPAFPLPPPLTLSDGTHGRGQISLKKDLLGREEVVCVVEVSGVGECDRSKFGKSSDHGIVELVDQLPDLCTAEGG
jgi:hypothetical protein